MFVQAEQIASEMGLSKNTVYEFAHRKEDPLPLRYLFGSRYGQALESELDEWFRRNGDTFAERQEKYGR